MRQLSVIWLDKNDMPAPCLITWDASKPYKLDFIFNPGWGINEATWTIGRSLVWDGLMGRKAGIGDVRFTLEGCGEDPRNSGVLHMTLVGDYNEHLEPQNVNTFRHDAAPLREFLRYTFREADDDMLTSEVDSVIQLLLDGTWES